MRSPDAARPHPGGRPLDSERPAFDDARPDPETPPGPTDADEAARAAAEADAAAARAEAQAAAEAEAETATEPATEPPEEPAAEPAAEPAPSWSAGPTGARSATGDETPLGLRGQAGATKDALLGLVQAHVDLAKAEADEIKGEVGRAAALGGLAAGCLLLIALLLPIGLLLFLGEWLFGSLGWGVLHGTLLLVGVAVLAGLLAIRVPGLGVAFLLALVTGVVVALLLGPSLPNELWRRIGESLNLGVDPAVRPLVVGVLVMAIAGGLLGLALGAGAGAAAGGLVGGALLGALVGAFSAITFGWQVGIAVGVAAGLAAWPAYMGAMAARSGIDTEALKARYWPQATIDTTKETIEWAKARLPLGPRS